MPITHLRPIFTFDEARFPQLADPIARAALHAKEARFRARLALRPRNATLVAARKAAGLTRRALAGALGVSTKSIIEWERHSVVPRDPGLRLRVAGLLGTWPWPEEAPSPAGPG